MSSSSFKMPKIDLKKIEEIEKNPELVDEVVWKWVDKSVKDPNLDWDAAMLNAAKELGLSNRAELTVLLHREEVFKDLAYAVSGMEGLKRAEMKYLKLKSEKEKVLKIC
ncbi:MAG: hypothetical protein ACE5KT_08485 [Methanosarcinales archaeon]